MRLQWFAPSGGGPTFAECGNLANGLEGARPRTDPGTCRVGTSLYWQGGV